MTARRIGLVLAILLSLASAIPAFIIGPDPETGDLTPAVAVAILSGGVLAATLALAIPAWRGGRRSAVAVAILQFAAIIPPLPAFLLPSDIVSPDAVVSAAGSVLLSVVAIGLIAYSSSRVLVLVAAILAILALYAVVVAVVSAVVPESAGRGVATLAAIGAALLFQPVLLVLRRSTDRTLYGERGDPAGTALRIGRTLGDQQEVVAAAVDETARALRLPRLELRDTSGVLAVGGSADAAGHLAVIPIGADRDLELVVTLRPGERRLHAQDRAALELTGLPLQLLVRESRLAADLQAARTAATEARESERARLHRDLHDGVGPLLTGAALHADAARNLVGPSGVPALEQLDAVRGELRAAVSEVRRVVDGLRPLDLEQRGLWDALQRRADLAGADFRASGRTIALSPAVELAVHRIVGEALANAERHAPGSLTDVRIDVDDVELLIRVTSSGSTPPARREGVGLSSIRERAAELGGHADVGPVPEGWRVQVRIPLPPSR
jgi:signal transduction histidine kinase